MEELNQRVREEKLRELAHIGDVQAIKDIVAKEKVDINSHNSVNGMTALHWAATRGHNPVVSYLLSQGADKSTVSKEGHTPLQLASSDEVIKTLQRDNDARIDSKPQFHKPNLPIIPNYISNPLMFPVGGPVSSTMQPEKNHHQISSGPRRQAPGAFSVLEEQHNLSDLVLKIRIASRDPDFIEVELNRSSLTFSALVELCCRELELDPEKLQKIRKLPNTILRNDNDVKRLTDFQELELILKPSKFSPMPVNGHDTLKQQIPQSFCY